ncbi:uncharacterized protein LOC119179083 [Rhipicephalus microplus]|uniref:uncharacterized protein LOC119179083 n=1 Tax=Rhipicephalus microplus TaxID=6941 RepID=UPI003F6BC9FF
MAPPMMDGPSGFILLGPSPADEIAAEMDNTSLIPKTRTSPRPSASSSQPSRRYLNRELAAQFEDLRSVSKVAAPPRDFATHRERAGSTRPKDSHSRAPKFIAVTDHSRRAETSSSATKSTQTRSTRTQPHDGSSDSESEDSSKTSKPSNSTPGPSGHGKPSMQPEGSSTKEKLKKASMVAGVAIVAGAAAVAVAPLALAAVGFTSSGVAAGSMAAAYQATLGGVIAKGMRSHKYSWTSGGPRNDERTMLKSANAGDQSRIFLLGCDK